MNSFFIFILFCVLRTVSTEQGVLSMGSSISKSIDMYGRPVVQTPTPEDAEQILTMFEAKLKQAKKKITPEEKKKLQRYIKTRIQKNENEKLTENDDSNDEEEPKMAKKNLSPKRNTTLIYNNTKSSSKLRHNTTSIDHFQNMTTFRPFQNETKPRVGLDIRKLNATNVVTNTPSIESIVWASVSLNIPSFDICRENNLKTSLIACLQNTLGIGNNTVIELEINTCEINKHDKIKLQVEREQRKKKRKYALNGENPSVWTERKFISREFKHKEWIPRIWKQRQWKQREWYDRFVVDGEKCSDKSVYVLKECISGCMEVVDSKATNRSLDFEKQYPSEAKCVGEKNGNGVCFDVYSDTNDDSVTKESCISYCSDSEVKSKSKCSGSYCFDKNVTDKMMTQKDTKINKNNDKNIETKEECVKSQCSDSNIISEENIDRKDLLLEACSGKVCFVNGFALPINDAFNNEKMCVSTCADERRKTQLECLGRDKKLPNERPVAAILQFSFAIEVNTFLANRLSILNKTLVEEIKSFKTNTEYHSKITETLLSKLNANKSQKQKDLMKDFRVTVENSVAILYSPNGHPKPSPGENKDRSLNIMKPNQTEYISTFEISQRFCQNTKILQDGLGAALSDMLKKRIFISKCTCNETSMKKQALRKSSGFIWKSVDERMFATLTYSLHFSAKLAVNAHMWTRYLLLIQTIDQKQFSHLFFAKLKQNVPSLTLDPSKDFIKIVTTVPSTVSLMNQSSRVSDVSDFYTINLRIKMNRLKVKSDNIRKSEEMALKHWLIAALPGIEGDIKVESCPLDVKTQNESEKLWTLVYNRYHSQFRKVYKQNIKAQRVHFNKLFRNSGNFIIRRSCEDCEKSHEEIFYKRLTKLEKYNPFNDFFHFWSSNENVLNVDFELYSNYDDAIKGKTESRWQVCTYNKKGVGFPGLCGPNKEMFDAFNAYDASLRWNINDDLSKIGTNSRKIAFFIHNNTPNMEATFQLTMPVPAGKNPNPSNISKKTTKLLLDYKTTLLPEGYFLAYSNQNGEIENGIFTPIELGFIIRKEETLKGLIFNTKGMTTRSFCIGVVVRSACFISPQIHSKEECMSIDGCKWVEEMRGTGSNITCDGVPNNCNTMHFNGQKCERTPGCKFVPNGFLRSNLKKLHLGTATKQIQTTKIAKSTRPVNIEGLIEIRAALKDNADVWLSPLITALQATFGEFLKIPLEDIFLSQIFVKSDTAYPNICTMDKISTNNDTYKSAKVTVSFSAMLKNENILKAEYFIFQLEQLQKDKTVSKRFAERLVAITDELGKYRFYIPKSGNNFDCYPIQICNIEISEHTRNMVQQQNKAKNNLVPENLDLIPTNLNFISENLRKEIFSKQSTNAEFVDSTHIYEPEAISIYKNTNFEIENSAVGIEAVDVALVFLGINTSSLISQEIRKIGPAILEAISTNSPKGNDNKITVTIRDFLMIRTPKLLNSGGRADIRLTSNHYTPKEMIRKFIAAMNDNTLVFCKSLKALPTEFERRLLGKTGTRLTMAKLCVPTLRNVCHNEESSMKTCDDIIYEN